MMELTLIRKYFKEKYTLGKLYYEQEFLCDTMEDVVRDLHDINHDGDFDEEAEGKIYGKTAIPCGRYKVIVTDSFKLKRRLPILLKVPGFTGIRIHGGKNETWTKGCILVGENKEKGSLVNYPYWEATIRNMIDEKIRSGEKCYISIKE
jgi:hypothetical protein